MNIHFTNTERYTRVPTEPLGCLLSNVSFIHMYVHMHVADVLASNHLKVRLLVYSTSYTSATQYFNLSSCILFFVCFVLLTYIIEITVLTSRNFKY